MLKHLAETGHQQLAYELVMQPTCPSYGFMVDSGATAMWECFDAWHPKLGINPQPMNGLNHLGMNSFFEWIFGYVGGIRPDPVQPGYQHFLIAPCAEAGPEWVEASYESVRGPITVKWRRSPEQVQMEVVVPPNTSAEVRIPAEALADVTESGRPVEPGRGFQLLGVSKGRASFHVGSGSYIFAARVSQAMGVRP